MNNKVYGIDLGTTYSCVAGFDGDGKVMVLENDQLEPTTPSVVYFEGRRAVVGAPAKEQAAVHPRQVVSAIKRLMGSAQIVRQSGRDLRPEMVSALILKKLVKDIGISSREKKPDVVITCPAYFGHEEREATKRAGELAGLNVLSIINEPSAAAVSYAVEQGDLSDKTVLVFDLGGGTFDVTVLRMERSGREIRVIATGGDSMLGGRDWDKALAEHFIHRFCEETGCPSSEGAEGTSFYEEMMLLAEKRKRQLSNSARAKISIEHGGRRCSFEYTREEFDSLTAGLLRSTLMMTKSVLEDAKKKDRGIDWNNLQILMVGGSTKMPQVEAMLEKEFGQKPKSYRPDEAVARGAAIRARQIKAGPGDLLLGGRTGETLTLGGEHGGITVRDVTSKSFGVKYLRDVDDKHGFVSNVIAKNTEVPFKPSRESSPFDMLMSFPQAGVSHGGTLRPNQTEVVFEIFENEEMSLGGELELYPEDECVCTKIGEMTLRGLPSGRPAHQPVTVFMEIDENGVLHAEGLDDQTRKRCEVTLKTERVLSREEARGEPKQIVDWFTVE